MAVELLEALMILCFGLSWPISIRKSWISQTAKGKSLFFEFFIWAGYIVGIVRKCLQLQSGEHFGWLFYMGLAFYIFNLIAISIDMALYFRNIKVDKTREHVLGIPRN